MMNNIGQVGIVPPWLGDDVPHVMNELPVLPLPPAPPDWDSQALPDDTLLCTIDGARLLGTTEL